MNSTDTAPDQTLIKTNEQVKDELSNIKPNDDQKNEEIPNIIEQIDEQNIEDISINVQLNDDQIYEDNLDNNLPNDEQNLENDIKILRSEIHSKTEYLKKVQNENRSLRKKYNELLNIMKTKEAQMKKDLLEKSNQDSIKWQTAWEKVISQITHVIPYTMPKDLNSEKQRNILVDITKELCEFAVRSNETVEYKNLKDKYQKTQSKLKKLKDQCSSLLEIIQNKQQSVEISQRQNHSYFANTNDKNQSKYRFNTVHDDILAFSKGYPYSNTRRRELQEFAGYHNFNFNNDLSDDVYDNYSVYKKKKKPSNSFNYKDEYKGIKIKRKNHVQDDAEFEDSLQSNSKTIEDTRKLDLSNLIIVEHIENDSKSFLFEQI